MRNQVFVQEHHLLEAVRRKVIDERQMQDVLAIARSMGQASRTPDLSWLSVVQTVMAGGIAFVPAMMALAHMHSGHAAETVVFSLVAVLGLLGASVLSQRNGLGKESTGIAAAGAAMWCWGIGAGLAGTLLFPDAFRASYDRYYSYGADVSWQTREAHRHLCYLAGDFTMILGALGIGLARKVPATAAPAAVAALAAIVSFSEWFAKTNHNRVDDAEAAMMLTFASAVLVGAAFVLQRVTRASRFDPAFWVHTVGILPLGIVGMILIDKESAMVLPWLLAAMGVVAVGVKVDRKSFIVAGCMGMMVYLPFGAAEARVGDTGVGMAFTFATVLVAATVLIVRKVYVARAAKGTDEIEQTVWA